MALRQKAIDRDPHPCGAVIVMDGGIHGEGISSVVVNTDSTAHAVIHALRDAAGRLHSIDLAGCVMYRSSRLCPIGETAPRWAGISRFYHHTEAAGDGPPRLR